MRHSTLSPSGAHRWARCPASVQLSVGLPNKSSPWAKEGTLAHEVAAACVNQCIVGRYYDGEFDGRRMLSASEFVGKCFRVSQDGEPLEEMEFTQELADLAQPGLDWIASRRIEYIEVEQWGDMADWLGLDPFTGERQGGMLDLGWIEVDAFNITIVIWDWKFGQEPVEVQDNWQLQLYARGFVTRNHQCIIDLMRQYPNRTPIVRLIIEQPRVAGGGSWFTTIEDLALFAEWISHRANIAQDVYRDPVLAPGAFSPGLKQCRWCPAREAGVCEAYDKFMLGTMMDKLPALIEDVTFRAPPPPLPKFLDPERRAWLLRHKRVIIEWLERLHAEALDDAIKGRPTPGMKVIKGRRGARKWTDEAAATERLKRWAMGGALDSIYEPPQLLSPPAVETLIGKPLYRREFQSLVSQGDGKPVLVDVDDPAEALEPLEMKLSDLPDDDLS